MTREDVFNILKGVCDQVFYSSNVGDITGPPVIVWAVPENTDFYADNEHYVGIATGWVDLYTKRPDFALERKLVSALKANGISYVKRNEMYAEETKMFLCSYNIEFIESEE